MERATDRRGLPELRRALAAGDGAPTRSELERMMLRLVAEAGLPRPEVNRRLGPYVVDFLWVRERVVVETDGWAAHGHRRAFEADRARDADLQARGDLVVRFTWRQISEAQLLVATRLAQVLASRA
jgi:very-short-patch-repair endonuclease